MRTAPRLKWHMLRRRRTDPPFLRANLEAGLKAGAALEVDVVATADGHFVCLHDLTLDRETTGRGPVAETTREELMGLHQRGGNGVPVEAPPLFLDEVVAAVARWRRPEAGLIQLDLKQRHDRFDEALIRRLRETLAGFTSGFIVGSCDWRLLSRLRPAMPEVAQGFDPLDLYSLSELRGTPQFEALAEAARRLVPEARIYYLEVDLVLTGLSRGVNLIEQVAGDRTEVDVWTVDADRPRLGEDLRRLLAAGCHQITTNDADVLQSILQEMA